MHMSSCTKCTEQKQNTLFIGGGFTYISQQAKVIVPPERLTTV